MPPNDTLNCPNIIIPTLTSPIFKKTSRISCLLEIFDTLFIPNRSPDFISPFLAFVIILGKEKRVPKKAWDYIRDKLNEENLELSRMVFIANSFAGIVDRSLAKKISSHLRPITKVSPHPFILSSQSVSELNRLPGFISKINSDVSTLLVIKEKGRLNAHLSPALEVELGVKINKI